ncbi:MAG: DUF2769 domain-containing protein [Alphaproteobacteria bacterium]|uniref:DUF2769 domain-containing protein n=1 Tax=Candidatus Nitrobium versatile TaxID=2884831 RepID=A0A953J6R4_9BACT|nr:DUF2769 domain-containing protein [Candidatus Nitrobium versatile]
MAMAVESKVPFIKANVMKCQCPRCPVQGNSRCAQQLIAELQNVLERETVLPREVPGLYCSSGLAGCGGLDYRNPCMCGTCPILNEEYDLAPGGPAGFFCKGGRAVSYREFGRLGETGG